MTLIKFIIIYCCFLFYYKNYIRTYFDFISITLEITLIYRLFIHKKTSSAEFPTSDNNIVNVKHIKMNSKKMKMYNLIDC